MADPIVNFFKSTLVGTYSDTDTSITIATGDGALLPDPSVDGSFNLTIFEGLQVTGSTEFEIVRVTARSGDVLTVTRGQESTTPLTIGSATHSILMSATKKTFDDINTAIANVDLTTLTNVESITYDNDGNEVFQLPAGTTAQRPNSPQTAYLRWNTDDSRPEIYNGNRWAGINLVGLQDVTLGVATATVTANDAVAQINTFISQFGTPASAFSVRQLGDTDVCMRVRRSSDNAETNIGFTADGDLDESALTTFTGANDGFVTTWYNQAVDTETLPADFGSGATASYSLRKVESGYTGNAIKVRRSSDNAEQDIGFVDGELDTSSLETFCGAGDGFVTTWYDQSGSNNATQSTAGSQPQIVSSGTTITENGKPAIDLDGSDDFLEVPSSTDQFNYLHDGTSSFVSSVVKISNSANTDDIEKIINNYSGASDEIGFGIQKDDRSGSGLTDAFRGGIGSSVSGTYVVFVSNNNVYTPSDNQYITSIRIDADNGTTNQRLIGNVNGGSDLNSTLISGASATTSNASSNMRFGAEPDGTRNLSGALQELIFYNTDQSSNREAIEANQASFYDIGISGSHAVQGTAGSQPKIVSSGSVIKENSIPALDFDGSDDFLTTGVLDAVSGDQSYFAVAKSKALSSDTEFIFGGADDSGRHALFLSSGSNEWFYFAGGSVISGGAEDTNQHIFTVLQSSTSTLFLDGSSIASGSAGTNDYRGIKISVDRNNDQDGNFLTQEIIVFTSDKSADRTDIESDIAGYFNITI